jgi:ubiquinone/menaquinone biosynthesis C-methylase UbiE
MSHEFIKEYWENQARTHKDSHKASWGDNFMIDLEIDAIGAHISAGDRVLDIGCANGHSAFEQLKRRSDIHSIVGVDFAENMIAQANSSKQKINLPDIARFEVGDARSLRFSDNSFDVAYTTRVVINLPSWEDQKVAINECLRVVRPGGKAIFSEAFWEPLVLLNAMRLLKQLPSLIEHDFNRYLKKSVLEEFFNQRGLKFNVNEFSSIYYLGSRFLRELVTDPTAYPDFSNPINQIFYDIENKFSGGGFGIQQAYIVIKQ